MGKSKFHLRKGILTLAALILLPAVAGAQKQSRPREEKPLIAGGDPPAVTILFLGALAGTIEPCF